MRLALYTPQSISGTLSSFPWNVCSNVASSSSSSSSSSASRSGWPQGPVVHLQPFSSDMHGSFWLQDQCEAQPRRGAGCFLPGDVQHLGGGCGAPQQLPHSHQVSGCTAHDTIPPPGLGSSRRNGHSCAETAKDVAGMLGLKDEQQTGKWAMSIDTSCALTLSLRHECCIPAVIALSRLREMRCRFLEGLQPSPKGRTSGAPYHHSAVYIRAVTAYPVCAGSVQRKGNQEQCTLPAAPQAGQRCHCFSQLVNGTVLCALLGWPG